MEHDEQQKTVSSESKQPDQTESQVDAVEFQKLIQNTVSQVLGGS